MPKLGSTLKLTPISGLVITFLGASKFNGKRRWGKLKGITEKGKVNPRT